MGKGKSTYQIMVSAGRNFRLNIFLILDLKELYTVIYEVQISW
jgi:hypothetical protein